MFTCLGRSQITCTLIWMCSTFLEAWHTRWVCEQIMLFCNISAQTPSWTSISVNFFGWCSNLLAMILLEQKGFTIYLKSWKLCCTNIKMGEKKLLFRMSSNAIWFTIHVNVSCIYKAKKYVLTCLNIWIHSFWSILYGQNGMNERWIVCVVYSYVQVSIHIKTMSCLVSTSSWSLSNIC